METLFNVSAKALIVHKNKVLLLEALSYSGDYFWEEPGGRVEGKDTLKETLARELDEEIGLFIHPKLFHLMAANIWYPTTEHPPKILLHHRIEIEDPNAIDMIKLSDEHSGMTWADKEDLQGAKEIHGTRLERETCQFALKALEG